MSEFGLEVTEFNIMYSLSTIPSIFLPFIGGLLIDNFGIRPTYMLFISLVVAGQFIVTLSALSHSFPLMIAGRVISGLGTDSLLLTKTVMIAKWFMGKELSFSLGLSLCISRVGTSLDGIYCS